MKFFKKKPKPIFSKKEIDELNPEEKRLFYKCLDICLLNNCPIERVSGFRSGINTEKKKYRIGIRSDENWFISLLHEVGHLLFSESLDDKTFDYFNPSDELCVMATDLHRKGESFKVDELNRARIYEEKKANQFALNLIGNNKELRKKYFDHMLPCTSTYFYKYGQEFII